MSSRISPAVWAALPVARAALEHRDTSHGIADAIVGALDAAQLLQSPETAAELAQLRGAAEPDALQDRIAELEGRLAAAEASPLAWTEQLDAKSLDNFLISLGQATEHEPMDGAIAYIHELLGSFRTAAAAKASTPVPETLTVRECGHTDMYDAVLAEVRAAEGGERL
ncbi:hypothetical protein [Streptomyces sp. NBC_01477]|uniref:hypothetical protein n=1 Tax=Streptomyces sp. NBC_01477 TaxID=2976015 RepID=UPI002E3686C4|nr:hypothetical protein [Streptomyces sp. NBC_01477]